MRILIIAPLLCTILLAVSCKSPAILSNGDGESRVLLESYFSVWRNHDAISIDEQIYGHLFKGATPVACDSMKLNGFPMDMDTAKQTRYKIRYMIDHRHAKDSLFTWSIYRTDAPDVHADVQLGAHAGVWISDDTISIEKGVAATAMDKVEIVGDSIYFRFRSYMPERTGTQAYFSFLDSKPIVLTPVQLRSLTVGAAYQLAIERIRTKFESNNGVVIETRLRYEDVKTVTIAK
ncbi:MAG: hypothetical protein NTX15_06040 [Candidatus Kapabacteria bacterium]|nr:hypothetical protein [Candidatus Kapabacteria bacterium]